ncbi:MAG: non-homologous end-joining DNA ligase [Acidobacteria bacterium]|nr:non-homologous end-joining DNA ligase [Acidobacteriota bacterium]MCA1649151.1 non-homologous end-joining DNA ligase [Acidobacteriota bacterium]
MPTGQTLSATRVRLGGAVITNPGKLFWPDDGLTKLDLAQFYTRIAGHILPWMKGRAITLERCPEGVRRSCFFQKQAPANLPEGIPTVRIPAPSADRDIDYIVGGTRKTLLTLVNLGCIAMHVMNSRTDLLGKPDWLAFDLDPSDGFDAAARAALLLRSRLEDHGLESYVKTSGGRGLHVFVPLRRGAEQDHVRAYAVAIARELAEANPRLVTVESRKANRRAPVYLDVMRNASGQTIVPPFSVRWRPKAPVSMPLEWDEVSPRLDPAVFTIKTAERRMAAKAPWSSFFGHRQTLPRI